MRTYEFEYTTCALKRRSIFTPLQSIRVTSKFWAVRCRGSRPMDSKDDVAHRAFVLVSYAEGDDP